MNSSMQIKNAEDLYTAGNYAVTANICESLLKENPDNYQALLLLGKALCACGEIHQALPYLRKTVDGCPDNMQALLQLGRALRLARKPGEAINYLKRALVSGRDYHVLLELGLSLFDANQYEEARTYLLDALSCRPDCRASIVHLGKIAQALGDEGLALDYFSRLIEQQPDNLLSYPSLIEALLVTGEPARADELCDRALLIEPACTPLFALKYLALTESGDDEGAAYLCDYEKLVMRSAAEIPEVFADAGDFNSFLTNHIMTNVSETMRPEDHSTMNGWQSDIGKLFERNEILGKQVEKTINTALEKYIAELSVDPGHPVNIGRPSDRSLGPTVRPASSRLQRGVFGVPQAPPHSAVQLL
mgnify:CR=1 FL=1